MPKTTRETEFQLGYRAALQDILTILITPYDSVEKLEAAVIEFVETGLGIR
jgi:hypothetical protein